MDNEQQQVREQKNSGKLYRKLLKKKTYHLFLVLTIHQMFLKLVQLRLYELYLNEKYMKNNWEAKNIDHLVKRIKQKANELDQKMLQGMIEDVRKKLRAMCRDGLYSVL